MNKVLTLFLISYSCFRGPPIELASIFTLEYKCMRRNEKLANENMKKRKRSMKIVETLFSHILIQIALHTAATQSSWASTGSIPGSEPRPDSDTMPSMRAVSGVLGVFSATLSHYHSTISPNVTLRVIVYLVRALVLQTRAGADLRYTGSISHAAALTNLSGSAHFWRGVNGINGINCHALSVITGGTRLDEERTPGRLSHAIIGLLGHLDSTLWGPLPPWKSISELIMIYVSHDIFILSPSLYLDRTTFQPIYH